MAFQPKIREGEKEEKVLTREQKFLQATTVILVLILFWSFIHWMEQKQNEEKVVWITLPLLFVIEIRGLWQYFKEADYGDLVFEGAHFLVVLSIFWYFLTKPHVENLLLLFTTFCYRTDQLRHNSRFFAAAISILIPLTVLPVTLRWVTDESIVTFFLIFYAVLVTSLWFSKFVTWYQEL